jgi:eukaryotic-like serine/threonine-protein kinase
MTAIAMTERRALDKSVLPRVDEEITEKWRFNEGDEIVPGRNAIRLLGGGYKYEAYLAWDERLHALVVAKLLRPHLAASSSGLGTLTAEAEALERLNHPVLLRSFGAVIEGPRPHVVLEFLEGPRLSTLIRKYGPLSLEQAGPLGLQLTSALHYMHQEEMVHLDVKPRNIIMSSTPRLIDLSVARSIKDALDATQPIGTDAYMAPEQGAPQLHGGMGPASDAWGWGVTMYEALTGELPFPSVDGDSDQRYPQLHLDPRPISRPLPPALVTALSATLERRPENRPTPGEIADMLEPLIAALPRRPVLTRLRPRLR